jgi:hypothetical protein
MARTRSNARSAAVPRRKSAAVAARGASTNAGKAVKNDARDGVSSEWEDVGEELDVIPDIDGLLDRPAANRGSESEARRRIEMLREDRLLQQALSDVFEL